MNSQQTRRPVFIVTGGQGKGKTSLLATVVEALRADHIPLRGFLSHVVMAHGLRAGYDIEFLNNPARMPLCRTDGSMTGMQLGPFTFSPVAVQAGIAALAVDEQDGNAIWFVDEIGPLEMRGQGWDAALPGLTLHARGAVVVVVRPDLVGTVQERYGFGATQVWNAENLQDGDRADMIRTLRALGTPVN